MRSGRPNWGMTTSALCPEAEVGAETRGRESQNVFVVLIEHVLDSSKDLESVCQLKTGRQAHETIARELASLRRLWEWRKEVVELGPVVRDVEVYIDASGECVIDVDGGHVSRASDFADLGAVGIGLRAVYIGVGCRQAQRVGCVR